MSVVERARVFATAAHAAVGQRRKYTGDDYIVHPAHVVDILRGRSFTTPEMLAAAWLHDVIEDTHVTPMQIDEEFGREVAIMVMMLTDVPNDMGNREYRKSLDRRRLGNASAEVQNIKLADIISNTSSIMQHDPDFAKVYLKEKAELLEVLTKADPELLKVAQKNL